MTNSVNETHDPLLKSWLVSANSGSDFSIQNLPFSVFRRAKTDEAFRGGVAIGDQILDLAALYASGGLAGAAEYPLKLAAQPNLNAFMAAGHEAWSALRLALSRGLRLGCENQSQFERSLVPQAEAEYALPCIIGDYTDFYTSVHHATNVGKQFRPDNPLLPNYKWVPIGYHGRASSIDVSGQAFLRPQGQIKAPNSEEPVVGASKKLDHELELGIFIGSGNRLGEPIPIERAEQHVFGICLFNDWSARDIQAWEYQPLGPFLAKNFASTISPWIVTLEALAPYRVPFSREEKDPMPLPYLDSGSNRESGGVDIKLQVLIHTQTMKDAGTPPEEISQSNFKYSYWTISQLVAHHTVNGCNLRPGDLLGTGTQSGPAAEQGGSFLELSAGGKHPIALSNGESRAFVEDGDSIIIRGYCSGDDTPRIGFGEVRSTVLPSKLSLKKQRGKAL